MIQEQARAKLYVIRGNFQLQNYVHANTHTHITCSLVLNLSGKSCLGVKTVYFSTELESKGLRIVCELSIKVKREPGKKHLNVDK